MGSSDLDDGLLDTLDNQHFGVVIDCGSTGSRVEVYSWIDHSVASKIANSSELSNLLVVTKVNKKGKEWQKKVHPGISTFSSNPSNVGVHHLEPLLAHAIDIIPPQLQPSTPLFLLATAGMRLLTTQQQQAILDVACKYARNRTLFLLPDCDKNFQVIDGKTEGLYGWIAINYLLDGFNLPFSHALDKGHHTYGFLDMGGASAQIAFIPNSTETTQHAEDLTLLRLRSLNGIETEYKVFVSTWLGYGANEARRRYVDLLTANLKPPKDGVLIDPCLPKGLKLLISERKLTLLGSGSLSKCLNMSAPLLEKNMDCLDHPCLFGGVHAPTIDFDVNHFIGVSEFWHSSHDIFDMGGAYDYATYSGKVENFCARDWKSISKDLKSQKWGENIDEDKAQLLCFKAAWMMNVLHEGFGVPRIEREFVNSPPAPSRNATEALIEGAKDRGFLDPFTSVDQIKGFEVSWTLGKMVLYAASTVPSLAVANNKLLGPNDPSLMVGFGPNSNKFYSEGEFYSSNGRITSLLSGGGPLSILSESFAMRRRVPGLLLILAMIALVLWLVLGKERRKLLLPSRLFLKRRKVMGARGIYERLEAGEYIDHEEDEVNLEQRAWALHELKDTSWDHGEIPKGNMPSTHISVSSAAVSRIGRSESRERLGLNRSREVSPTGRPRSRTSIPVWK